MKNIAIVLTAAVLALAPVHASPIQLRDGDFVAFVGGTDLVRMQKDGRLEAALTARFLVAQPKFRDLAWEGDAVEVQSTVHERWRRDAFGGWRDQLKRVGATVVIAQLGKMESLAGTEGLAGFVERYGTLLDEPGGDGRRVVLLQPHGFEWETRGGNRLPDYTAAIRQLAEKRGLPFVSLAEMKALEESAPVELAAAVREKHRLWYDYWRPANWKCLFGDDGERIFSNAAEGLPSFKQEWETFPGLIAVAEAMVLRGELPIPAPTPSREGCAAFHRIGDSGGIIGPDLSAVGSGVSAERIVTEVLWPARQVKDGFSLTRLTLRDGGVVQGYPQVSRDEKRLLLRDFATGHIQEFPAGEIVGREEYSCKRGVRLMIDENGKTSRTVIEDPFVPADIHERDWNHLRVVAKSRNFTFSINGKLASEFTHNAKAGRFDSGGIARQIHDKGMSAEFKDIRLKKLEMEPQPDNLK